VTPRLTNLNWKLRLSKRGHCDLTMFASEIICVVTHPSSNQGRRKTTSNGRGKEGGEGERNRSKGEGKGWTLDSHNVVYRLTPLLVGLDAPSAPSVLVVLVSLQTHLQVVRLTVCACVRSLFLQAHTCRS